MSGRRPPRQNTFSSIQAEMDRAELNRRRAVRTTILCAALATLFLVALAVSAVGSGVSRTEGVFPAPSTPEPTPEPQPTPEPEPAPSVESKPELIPEPGPTSTVSPDVQRLDIAIGVAGYEPSVVSAKAGIPIEITVAQGTGCAAGFLVPALDVAIDNSEADVTRNLGALAVGDYRFTCGMEMVEGVLQVR